ncbi:hypothetical protein L210DRAFT_3644499 [Boletus edulis BED1]|uniref:Major facilitator superfamily (MFS) profile domain-containing protein n=1 Tax=Boletus edulis BED1 TaxID=1328754 RepID=A0AAD4BXM1_BOLED|nr:hypothetical protein L210DRAFT_3644499 [Boletus edulis BED1]
MDFLTLIAEPFSSMYIVSFINQEKTIARSVIIQALSNLFFFTQALTAWHWGQLSDSMGRRPLVLLGLFGLSVFNFAFGLSRTLARSIIRDVLKPVYRWHSQWQHWVMKSMLGDPDDTNMAQVFTLVLPISRIGGTIAPLYGGALEKPQERWPHVFQGEFWATYSYFLPSLVSGCFVDIFNLYNIHEGVVAFESRQN